ncbi:MAG: hypothetical protein AABY53_07070 [Bdellovibrionota bacterium]
MKTTILSVLTSLLIAVPAYAIDMNAEVFVTHKVTLTDGAQKEGTDVERFRIFISNKFDDQWTFKGRFEFKAGTADADATKNTKSVAVIPEAHFVGTSVLMDGDTLKFGIIENGIVTAESAMGTRWISKTLADDEAFAANSSIQSGASYAIKFANFGVNFFSLSGESGDSVDTDDNNKLNGAMLDYQVNESTKVWLQNSILNEGTVGVAAAAAKSTNILSVGVLYRIEDMDLNLNYHQAAYAVEAGIAPKNNTVIGINGVFKKVGGSSTNVYAHYWTGFDKFADTGEATSAKAMIGPTWNLADNKINLGLFYQAETFQDDYKTANPTVKEPSAMYVKIAAKF